MILRRLSKNLNSRGFHCFIAKSRLARRSLPNSIYRPPDFGTIRIFATNITERKRAEEQLRYQAFLLENVSDAIVASDMNFIIQSWNKAAEEIYGWWAAEVIGKSVSEVLQRRIHGARRRDDPPAARRGRLERRSYSPVQGWPARAGARCGPTAAG